MNHNTVIMPTNDRSGIVTRRQYTHGIVIDQFMAFYRSNAMSVKRRVPTNQTTCTGGITQFDYMSDTKNYPNTYLLVTMGRYNFSRCDYNQVKVARSRWKHSSEPCMIPLGLSSAVGIILNSDDDQEIQKANKHATYTNRDIFAL